MYQGLAWVKSREGAPNAWFKSNCVLPHLAACSLGNSWRLTASSSVTNTGRMRTFGGRDTPGITKRHGQGPPLTRGGRQQ